MTQSLKSKTKNVTQSKKGVKTMLLKYQKKGVACTIIIIEGKKRKVYMPKSRKQDYELGQKYLAQIKTKIRKVG